MVDAQKICREIDPKCVFSFSYVGPPQDDEVEDKKAAARGARDQISYLALPSWSAHCNTSKFFNFFYDFSHLRVWHPLDVLLTKVARG